MQGIPMDHNNQVGGRGAQWNVESASFVPGQAGGGPVGQRMMPMPPYGGYAPPYVMQPGDTGSGLVGEDFPPVSRGQFGMGRGAPYAGAGVAKQHNMMGQQQVPHQGPSKFFKPGQQPQGPMHAPQPQQQQQQPQQQQPISTAQRLAMMNNFFPTSAESGNEYFVYPQQQQASTSGSNPRGFGPNTAGIPPATPASNPPPGRKLVHSFFMSDTIRSDLQKKILLQLRGTNPDDPLVQNLPKTIHRYHSLYPLEDITKDRSVSRVFGMPSFCYKAISMSDGKSYVLRKMDTPRLQQPDFAMQAIELWKSIQHPGVVGLKEVFISAAFNNINSLFFVYDYHPGAETLDQKFPAGDKSRPGAFISEESLWSFLIQLVAALKAIHDAGLSARTLLASKVLLTGKNRVRINCVGIDDFFNFDMRRNTIQMKQLEDIVSLGKLMIRLASPTVDVQNNPNQLPRALESIAASYSSEFHQTMMRILGLGGAGASSPSNSNRRGGSSGGVPGTPPTLEEIQQLLTSRMFSHMDKLYSYNDSMEAELAKEVENGRLVRLLVKLGFINERPEYDMAASWSETGDRYLLKLFRDYVFHQVDEDGSPVLDFSHVIESLNKLDIGSEEKILLTSRDEKSMLVLSYKDLRRCLAEAFAELVQRSQQAQSQASHAQGNQPTSSANFYAGNR